jgi:hypothetical protein
MKKRAIICKGGLRRVTVTSPKRDMIIVIFKEVVVV